MSLESKGIDIANKITDFIVSVGDLPPEDYDIALSYIKCELGHGDLEDKFVQAALELLKFYQKKYKKLGITT